VATAHHQRSGGAAAARARARPPTNLVLRGAAVIYNAATVGPLATFFRSTGAAYWNGWILMWNGCWHVAVRNSHAAGFSCQQAIRSSYYEHSSIQYSRV
jgi:hypothetical protein